MKWIDIEDIAEILNNTYPEESVISLRFTDLQKKILSIDGFVDKPERCNEKILETIQAAWLELKNDT